MELKTSSCCNASIIENSDVCSKCKEHYGSNEELKTLKDLDMWHLNNENYGSMEKEHGICIEDLKQSGIEDIKAIQNFEDTLFDKAVEEITGIKVVYSEEAKQGIINYIKWKFNLDTIFGMDVKVDKSLKKGEFKLK